MPSLDIVTWQTPFRNCLHAPTTQLFFNARTTYKLGSGRQMRLGISWKNQFQFSNIINIKVPVTQKLHSRIIKAIATVEPNCLVHSQDGPTIASNLEFESNSQMLLSSAKDDSELDDREKLRRSRISKANKGNVPWNKGRKHSPETLQRIRERTRIAMQDPKVKMKLVNIGHAQSEETRVKIGIGVREGWQRRRDKLLVQETCCLEWQNMIAEASRKGYNGEEELQWDSYKFLDNELKKQWLESVEKRKTMPRPKGSKRAPKSLEQRKKISEAISAKWADPGYRDRVCSALAKYHGVPVGAERKPRRKRPHQTQSAERVRVKKKPVELEDAMFESKVIKKSTTRKKKNAAPMYKDPMASAKLEMIKKIKAQRTEMENRKREATERAKLLIAEAEKAADALEVAALKSPLARASLLETRKLIAEATRSIESIERGEIASQDNGNSISPSREASVRHPLGSPEGPVRHTLPVEGMLIIEVARSIESIDRGAIASQDNANSNSRIREVTARHPLDSHEDPLVGNMLPVEEKVNGMHQLSSSDQSTKDLEFDKLTLQNAVNVSQPLPVIRNADYSTGGINSRMSPSFQLNNASEKSASDGKVLQVGLLKFNGECKNESTGYEENQEKQISKVDNSNIPAARTKKKWISGRLVEVEED